MTQQNQPVHRIRLGSIGVAIFENRTKDDVVYYNTMFDRSIKTEEGWKQTASFRRIDLLPLAKAADLAHTWITRKVQSGNAVSIGEE